MQLAPAHDPSGAIVNVVVAVTSPREFPYWSRASTVYACDAPATIELEPGATTSAETGAGVTVSAAVAVFPLFDAVTV